MDDATDRESSDRQVGQAAADQLRAQRAKRFVGGLDETKVTRPEELTLAASEAAALARLVFGD